MIFKEIYQNKPTQAPLPIVHMPAAPERPVIQEVEQRDGLRRETEMERQEQAFKQKFTDIARACDGKIKDMGAGFVEHWLEQVKGASELYDKLYNVLHN